MHYFQVCYKGVFVALLLFRNTHGYMSYNGKLAWKETFKVEIRKLISKKILMNYTRVFNSAHVKWKALLEKILQMVKIKSQLFSITPVSHYTVSHVYIFLWMQLNVHQCTFVVYPMKIVCITWSKTAFNLAISSSWLLIKYNLNLSTVVCVYLIGLTEFMYHIAENVGSC